MEASRAVTDFLDQTANGIPSIFLQIPVNKNTIPYFPYVFTRFLVKAINYNVFEHSGEENMGFIQAPYIVKERTINRIENLMLENITVDDMTTEINILSGPNRTVDFNITQIYRGYRNVGKFKVPFSTEIIVYFELFHLLYDERLYQFLLDMKIAQIRISSSE